MGVFEKNLFGVSKYDLAVGRLKTLCRNASSHEWKKVFVAFSGGKDSQCCYHLCKEADVPFVPIYSVTRFEPPELIDFIREHYQDAIFRKTYKRSLIEDIRLNGLPTRYMRWCCKTKHVADKNYEVAVIGVRWEESAARRETWRISGFKPDKTFYVCPIADWTQEDVWEFLNARKIPHCKLYDDGMPRIGCVCCPLAPNKRMDDSKRWPRTARMLRLGADAFVARMREMGFVSKHGKKVADWCEAANQEEEYWNRWVNTGSTLRPVGYTFKDNPEQCVFEGSGFSESDGREEEETE